MKTFNSLHGLRGLVRSLILLSLALCMTQMSQAQRRNFAATYQLSGIVKDGDNVSLTISLSVHNSSGGDIQNGGIALYSSNGPHAVPIDAFETIKLFPNAKDVAVSQQFTVPKRDYERWKQGENPNLKFLMPDGNGGTRIVPIDLSRAVALPVVAE